MKNDIKTNMSIALYFDLENVDDKLNLNSLLDAITLNVEETEYAVFAIKLACGKTKAIDKFREQMKDLNFNIRETPQVSEKNLKNRADLILSLEAFECFYQKSPDIDLYVFITADTDFTVVMDKLRKHGKQVWLVTKKCDKEKKLFTSSTDKILVIEDYFTKEITEKNEICCLEKDLSKLDFSDEESKKLQEIIESYNKDQWYLGSSFGTKLKNLIKNFSYRGKKVNSQNKLFDDLVKKGYIETKKEDKTDYFKVIS